MRDNLRHASLATTSMYLHTDDARRARQVSVNRAILLIPVSVLDMQKGDTSSDSQMIGDSLSRMARIQPEVPKLDRTRRRGVSVHVTELAMVSRLPECTSRDRGIDG